MNRRAHTGPAHRLGQGNERQSAYPPVQTTLPLLNPGASIVLTGSTVAYTGTPAFSIYAATKAAILLRAEHGSPN